MKKSNVIFIAVIVVIILIIASLVGSYNGLVSKKENVATQSSNLDVMLQRRADLIPNLVNTVKGYTTHETEIINSITDARAKLVGSSNLQEKAKANDELTSALNALMVVVENYPDLKSSQNFIQLSDELAGTENRIATARRDYNESVKTYNTSIKTFPTNIIASMFNFEQSGYIEVTEAGKQVPTVEF